MRLQQRIEIASCSLIFMGLNKSHNEYLQQQLDVKQPPSISLQAGATSEISGSVRPEFLETQAYTGHVWESERANKKKLR